MGKGFEKSRERRKQNKNPSKAQVENKICLKFINIYTFVCVMYILQNIVIIG